MNPKNEHEVEQLEKEAPEVDQEISLAADETMVYEAVQEVKGKVAEFIAKYEHVLTELNPKDQKRLMRTIGLKVKEMEEKLTEIRQAPE